MSQMKRINVAQWKKMEDKNLIVHMTPPKCNDTKVHSSTLGENAMP